MPLVRREDSVFVVVDAQKGFFAYDGLAEGDAIFASKAVARIAWSKRRCAIIACMPIEFAGRGNSEAIAIDAQA